MGSSVFQDKRLNVTEALAHPYLDEGRLRYHSCMCTCCASTNCGGRQYTHDFEPTAPHAFDDTWENEVGARSLHCRMTSSKKEIFRNDDQFLDSKGTILLHSKILTIEDYL